MGLCSSCCTGSSSESEYETPDVETRRQQLIEAAERRQHQQENRGIKDPEKVKRLQQRSHELERLETEAAKSNNYASLKWQSN